MKHINKQGAPIFYLAWCQKMKGQENEDYRNLPSKEKGILLKALVKQQGKICAYTMRRIDTDTSHVEHIKPESICRQEMRGSDLDFQNMVACFPREGMRRKYRYGAQEKDNWWENEGELFLSPLRNTCEIHLKFNLKGEVLAANDNVAALKTIDVLNLNHNSLKDDRKRAIQEFIYGASGTKPLSIKKTENAISNICEPNSEGDYIEFCTAIKHGLNEHKTTLQKIAQKKKYIQSHKRSKGKRRKRK